MYKQTKAYTSIRNKLVAAVAMLLVASIMMVSTSYAWFTLSTAPEVTGITTTVGSNGSLEIALSPASGDAADIPLTAQGQAISQAGVLAANKTWGNLIDLSDASYGLGLIKLMPATRNVTGLNLNSNALAYPQYGYDGRVTTLSSGTMSGTFYNPGDVKNGYFRYLDAITDSAIDSLYGVRAVGSSNSMSKQQLGLSAAKAVVATGMTTARNGLSAALNNNGTALTNMLIAHATLPENAEDTNKYDQYIPSLEALVVGIETSMDTIETSLLATVKAVLATAIEDPTTFEAVVNLVGNGEGQKGLGFWTDTTNTETLNGVTTEQLTAIRTAINAVSGFTTAKEQYDDTVTKVTEVRNKLTVLKEQDQVDVDDVEWDDVSPLLNAMVNSQYVDLCGFKISEVKDNISKIISAVANGGLKVALNPGSGIFVDVAKLCGDYSAGVTVSDLKYGDMVLVDSSKGDEPLPATMETKAINASDSEPSEENEPLSQIPAARLVPLQASVKALTTSFTAASEVKITDYYGYIIDLFVRTNAAGSNLLLQTEGIDRIYSDNDDEAADTMGGGANMSFAINPAISEEQMQKLMSAMRVVFFDKAGNEGNGKIYAEARLDVANWKTVTVDGQTVKEVPLKIWIAEAAGEAEGEVILGHFAGEEAAYSLNGVVQNDKKAANPNEKPIITALTQNVATSVSVLVYIEGEQITNADVSNAAEALSGKLNLQFSSDADLKPMDYAPLKDQTQNP